MSKIKKFRELFWPLLEPLNQVDFKPIHTDDLVIEENDLDLCWDLTLRYYDSEEDRRNSIETKSTIFISAIGFVIAILLSMATDLLLNSNIKAGFLTSFSILMWVFIVVYFCRTVWFSIRALERQGYHRIGYKDITTGRENYRKILITEVINKTRKNSLTINLKVDNMVMAQEYFKRGVVAAVIYSLVVGIYGFIFKANWDYIEIINSILRVFSAKWFPLLNMACLMIIIVIFFQLRMRNKR